MTFLITATALLMALATASAQVPEGTAVIVKQVENKTLELLKASGKLK